VFVFHQHTVTLSRRFQVFCEIFWFFIKIREVFS